MPLPFVKTPRIDAPRALQPDLTPYLPTECISAHVPPQVDIPLEGDAFQLSQDFRWNSVGFHQARYLRVASPPEPALNATL